jgi:hypothetical protein
MLPLHPDVVRMVQQDRERELMQRAQLRYRRESGLSGYTLSMSRTKVYVCRKCKRSDCLIDVVEKTDAKLILVGCQKICDGPVAGTEVAGRMEWFSRVDSAKRLAGLRLLIRRQKRRPVKALERRRVIKRSGRRPR